MSEKKRETIDRSIGSFSLSLLSCHRNNRSFKRQDNERNERWVISGSSIGRFIIRPMVVGSRCVSKTWSNIDSLSWNRREVKNVSGMRFQDGWTLPVGMNGRSFIDPQEGFFLASLHRSVDQWWREQPLEREESYVLSLTDRTPNRFFFLPIAAFLSQERLSSNVNAAISWYRSFRIFSAVNDCRSEKQGTEGTSRLCY